MLDENFIKLSEIEVKISDSGEILFDKNELKEFYQKGFINIKIIFLGKPEEAIENLNIEKELFYKIREIQKLPDAVVIDFIDSKGKLEIEYLNEQK